MAGLEFKRAAQGISHSQKLLDCMLSIAALLPPKSGRLVDFIKTQSGKTRFDRHFPNNSISKNQPCSRNVSKGLAEEIYTSFDECIKGCRLIQNDRDHAYELLSQLRLLCYSDDIKVYNKSNGPPCSYSLNNRKELAYKYLSENGVSEKLLEDLDGLIEIMKCTKQREILDSDFSFISFMDNLYAYYSKTLEMNKLECGIIVKSAVGHIINRRSIEPEYLDMWLGRANELWKLGDDSVKIQIALCHAYVSMSKKYCKISLETRELHNIIGVLKVNSLKKLPESYARPLAHAVLFHEARFTAAKRDSSTKDKYISLVNSSLEDASHYGNIFGQVFISYRTAYDMASFFGVSRDAIFYLSNGEKMSPLLDNTERNSLTPLIEEAEHLYLYIH